MNQGGSLDGAYDYERFIDNALRRIFKNVLAHVAKKGLSGGHHFYLGFLSKYPGVKIPEHLVKKYPDEIVIVLQHQFYGLQVNDISFSVSLSFDNVVSVVIVPFAALTYVYDPHANFKFNFTRPIFPNTNQIDKNTDSENQTSDDSKNTKDNVIQFDKYKSNNQTT